MLAGCVVAGGRWLSSRVVLTVAAATGMWHGLAHGMEMPTACSPPVLMPGAGAGSGGIVLLAGGLATRFPAQRPELPRWAGGGLAAAGAWLLVSGLAA